MDHSGNLSYPPRRVDHRSVPAVRGNAAAVVHMGAHLVGARPCGRRASGIASALHTRAAPARRLSNLARGGAFRLCPGARPSVPDNANTACRPSPNRVDAAGNGGAVGIRTCAWAWAPNAVTHLDPACLGHCRRSNHTVGDVGRAWLPLRCAARPAGLARAWPIRRCLARRLLLPLFDWRSFPPI